MAAMIEDRGGDAGEGLAFFAAIECVAGVAGLLEFGEKAVALVMVWRVCLGNFICCTKASCASGLPSTS